MSRQEIVAGDRDRQMGETESNRRRDRIGQEGRQDDQQESRIKQNGF